MAKILCTHPGRFGDILWALPTMRALSEAYEAPVELMLSAKYESLRPLLDHQPYISCTGFDPAWRVQETAPISPRCPPQSEVYEQASAATGERYYDHVYHLGYRGWPEPTLARATYLCAHETAVAYHVQDPTFDGLGPLDLARPWITPPHQAVRLPTDPPVVWVGWSEEWFELKVGVLVALAARFPTVAFQWVRPWGGRYDEVDRTTVLDPGVGGRYHHRLGPNVSMVRADWAMTASLGSAATVYLGCLSSQWVLANALGIRCVVVEPNPHRHHPVFYRACEKNHLVLGNDGKPTFDARHAGDALEEVLNG